MPLPEDVQAHELDRDVRKELLSLSKETADLVARHLVMAGRLIDDDPQSALPHARAARALAGRVGAVREASGLVEYAAGQWAEALSELRAARRITGQPDHLPVMADCERALGRPERALLVAEDPQVSRLSPAARVELLIVVSGARRDLGQSDAAVLTLQVSALDAPPLRPWTARLRYAYADALLEAGRPDEAWSWFAAATEDDEHGETDAEERLLELDGIVVQDLHDDGSDDDAFAVVDGRGVADAIGFDAEGLAAQGLAVESHHAQDQTADGPGARASDIRGSVDVHSGRHPVDVDVDVELTADESVVGPAPEGSAGETPTDAGDGSSLPGGTDDDRSRGGAATGPAVTVTPFLNAIRDTGSDAPERQSDRGVSAAPQVLFQGAVVPDDDDSALRLFD